MTKRLNDMSKEVVDRNFLEETPDIPTEQKVVIATEMPSYEKVVFRNLRDPGASLHFHYQSKTHPLKHYDLLDGFTYELPTEICLHLEGQGMMPNSCHAPRYGQRTGQAGTPECYIQSYTPYFQLQRVRK